MRSVKLLEFGIGRQKLAVLVAWFVALVGIRLLLSAILSNMWIGTVGAVGLTFGLFYVALVYTPLRRYKFVVNDILQEWYRKKYLIYSVAVSASVVLMLIVLIDYGYNSHAKEIVSLRDITTIYGAQDHVAQSVRDLASRGYSFLDIFAITAASVDSSLNGYYLKSASFVFAEHLEVMAFMLVARRYASLFG